MVNPAPISENLAELRSLHAALMQKTSEVMSSIGHQGGGSGTQPAISVLSKFDADTATEPAIRKLIKARRARSLFFDADLFADPAWDMMLDLYAAHLAQARVSVSSLCVAAAVPATTALRWIATLEKAGVFNRHQDPLDARRSFITLSDDALGRLETYFASLV